jgi:5-methylcytosine-specific restriction endonuclease McrA
MAVVPASAIWIRETAHDLIEQLVRLRARRLAGHINRSTFLRKWGEARGRLYATPEYRRFRRMVLDRCNGVCELCGRAEAVEVHHTAQASYHPRLILVSKLARGACVDCHKAVHKDQAA